MPNVRPVHALIRGGLIGGLVAVVSWPLAGRSAEVDDQQAFPAAAPGSHLPIVRQADYVVNARIRPLAVFWIGRDNVGEARFIWREGPGERKGLELLVGSDPERTPRQINRWGFIAEAIEGDRAEALAFMKGAAEETLEDASASVDADRQPGGTSTFRAVRTVVTGSRAETGTLSVQAPPSLTYRQLDALLRLLPTARGLTDRKVINLPPGAKEGFLTAMTSMIAASRESCRRGTSAGVAPVTYLYKQSLYDLRLTGCSYRAELRTKAGAYPDAIEGRFEIRNRASGARQGLQIAYGTTAALRDVPVRIVFRPRWWMEAELLLDQGSIAQ